MTFLEGAGCRPPGSGRCRARTREACRLVFGELPDLPHLPELPARGPGADMIGSDGAFLTDLRVDLQPSGWRFVPRAGLDSRRASDLLARDLDALEEIAEGWQRAAQGPGRGPWTLAATLELPRGDRALADPGAVRDLAESLADGLGRHATEIRRRIPGARRCWSSSTSRRCRRCSPGTVPTASGFDVLPAVEGHVALEMLRTVLTSVGGDGVRVGVHCCASDAPIRLLTEAGAAFLGLDMRLLRAAGR